jgi:hypothetical protein
VITTEENQWIKIVEIFVFGVAVVSADSPITCGHKRFFLLVSEMRETTYASGTTRKLYLLQLNYI